MPKKTTTTKKAVSRIKNIYIFIDLCGSKNCSYRVSTFTGTQTQLQAEKNMQTNMWGLCGGIRLGWGNTESSQVIKLCYYSSVLLDIMNIMHLVKPNDAVGYKI